MKFGLPVVTDAVLNFFVAAAAQRSSEPQDAPNCLGFRFILGFLLLGMSELKNK